MTRKPSTIGPSSTRLVPTVPSSATVKTILLRLIGSNRAVRHQQRIVLAAEQPKPAEKSRRQEAILVVEDRAAANGAGLGIEHVVDKIHSAVMLVIGLVGEPHRDRILHIAG